MHVFQPSAQELLPKEDLINGEIARYGQLYVLDIRRGGVTRLLTEMTCKGATRSARGRRTSIYSRYSGRTQPCFTPRHIAKRTHTEVADVIRVPDTSADFHLHAVEDRKSVV